LPRHIPEDELRDIEEVVASKAGKVSAQEIADALPIRLPLRTLQYRLKHLVMEGRLRKDGAGRGTRYSIGPTERSQKEEDEASEQAPVEDIPIPLSARGEWIREYLRRPLADRDPVGYNRSFLDSYRPGSSAYLSDEERNHLAGIGRMHSSPLPGGTYTRQLLNRLLIDLSWNSSRLEGNTYSLLDTRRLIEFGEEAKGKERIEAQMILNHKDAIEFLVSGAEGIGFNRYTILNLHAMLANNLLSDPEAIGRLRHIAVAIEGSTFHPLEVPQLIDECFDTVLRYAALISNPFEQAFFFMAQIPYLQPFDDVNKRVSRIAANIPLIRENLSPLSFTDVPRSLYTDAVLGIYERNEIDLLKDVFIWAYERSAKRHVAVRQSLGEPDPFKLKYGVRILEVVSEIVRGALGRKFASTRIASFAEEYLDPSDREKFREAAEEEILGLHEGNFARYRITPAEFETWLHGWIKEGDGRQ